MKPGYKMFIALNVIYFFWGLSPFRIPETIETAICYGSLFSLIWGFFTTPKKTQKQYVLPRKKAWLEEEEDARHFHPEWFK